MTPELLERYADLIVSVGANVQPDQVVAVEALLEAQPLVHAHRAPRLREGRALRRCPVLRRRREADPRRAGARGDARLGAAVARPAHGAPRRAERSAMRARPARSSRPARRRRSGTRRARPAADDQGDVPDDRGPVDRVDALAAPDARLGAARLSGARRRRGARAALAGRRAHLPARRARPGASLARPDRADLPGRDPSRRARPGRLALRRAGHRAHGGPPALVTVREGGRLVADPHRHPARAEPPDRGGLHDARSRANRRRRARRRSRSTSPARS